MWGDQGMVLLCRSFQERARTANDTRLKGSCWPTQVLNRQISQQGWGEDFPNHPVFWNFSSDNNKKKLVWETGREDFSNLPFFGEFQPWKPISQTYPFLRFSRLKRSKRGRFEKSSPSSFSNLPFFEVFRADLLRAVSQTYPFLRLSGLKRSKRGRFEKSSPSSFSNLPFFGLFRAETLRKG